MTAQQDWHIYSGTGIPRIPAPELPDVPPWRRYNGKGTIELPADDGGESGRRIGKPYERLPSPEEVDAVNAALHLRAPLLVTGPAGSGKASLAYVVARELSFGPVLRWNVTARTTLADGIGRARRLGPLGTALLPYDRPRVLLITALDRAPLDLPEEIMAWLETGEFVVDEPDVSTYDNVSISLDTPLVRCREFPVVIITGSADRDFSPSFLRRCLRLRMPEPTPDRLTALVSAQLGAVEGVDKLIAQYLTHENLGVDQLLNAAHPVRRTVPDVATGFWHQEKQE